MLSQIIMLCLFNLYRCIFIYTKKTEIKNEEI